MEGNVTKCEDDVQKSDNLTENRFPDENSKEDDNSDIKTEKKSIVDLSKEEESLRTHLDKLKKENFVLQASIKAWQSTLQDKLEEFKQADLKLDDIHNEIWSEREKFCSKADEFNDSYGLLSDWWEAQMKFVSDLENLEERSKEDRKCRDEIKKLEREVEELRREINGLQTRQQLAEVEVHATPDEDSSPVRGGRSTEEVSPRRTDAKKAKYSEADDRIEVCSSREPTTDDLYSIVDLEKMRMVNRNRNRHRKNRLLGKVKDLLTL